MKNLDKHDMKKMFYVENENNKTKCFGICCFHKNVNIRPQNHSSDTRSKS